MQTNSKIMDNSSAFGAYPEVLPEMARAWLEHSRRGGLQKQSGAKVQIHLGFGWVFPDEHSGQSGFSIFPAILGNLAGLTPIDEMLSGVDDLSGRIRLCPTLEWAGCATIKTDEYYENQKIAFHEFLLFVSKITPE
jgi:hypothetical protein